MPVKAPPKQKPLLSDKPKLAKENEKSQSPAKKPKKTLAGSTKLSIRYDCGFENFLTIRGSGGDLSWEKGVSLKNVAPNEWIYESLTPFTCCEFKVLLNDCIFERGPNRSLDFGSETQITPHF